MFYVASVPLRPITCSPALLQMAATRICAGFPSPADDYIEAPVDLA